MGTGLLISDISMPALRQFIGNVRGESCSYWPDNAMNQSSSAMTWKSRSLDISRRQGGASLATQRVAARRACIAVKAEIYDAIQPREPPGRQGGSASRICLIFGDSQVSQAAGADETGRRGIQTSGRCMNRRSLRAAIEEAKAGLGEGGLPIGSGVGPGWKNYRPRPQPPGAGR